jgi:O-antigen/teichoic acid export membrane protein
MSDSKIYSKEYFKIYFTQFISLGLKFGSLLIVIPALSSKPEIYGIYALCISMNIFLNYADLGFLDSSKKYAIESYSQEDKENEYNFIGFGGFVTILITVLLSIVFFYLSYKPDILISNLETDELILISSKLLFIQALSFPIIVFHRIISIIFEIRLKQYVSKLIVIIFNTIIIASTFYFFRGEHYLIIEYFAFMNLMLLLTVLTQLLILTNKFNYDVFQFFKHLKFNKKIYSKTKKLAYPSLLNMLSWIIFFELDQIVVAKFIGPKEVAFFAIALSFSSLLRTVFGIIFSPFVVRANYFVGLKDNNGLNQFLMKLIFFTAPLTILPCVTLSLISESLILSWVGSSYAESILMAKLFSMIFCFSFISYVAGIYLTSKEKIKEIYLISIIMPFVYWIGVLLTYSNYGIMVFPFFKLFTIITSIFYYANILNRYRIFLYGQFYKLIIKLILPLSCLIVLINIALEFFPTDKGTINFLIVFLTSSSFIAIALIIHYLINKDDRIFLMQKFSEIIK